MLAILRRFIPAFCWWRPNRKDRC